MCASMAQATAQIVTLRHSILDDILTDFGLSSRFARKMLEPLLWLAAHRFAHLAARFDRAVLKLGFQEALRRVLPILVHDVYYRGTEHIPTEGPLLVVSNHPGSYDSLAIAAGLPRSDLQIVAAGFRTLRSLPHASQHLIFVNPQSRANLSAVRSVICHLRSGGAVLVFPGGCLEPDPVLLPGASEALHAWSPSMQLFLDSVPRARTMITVASGFIAPRFLRSPLARLGNGRYDPLAIAEIAQGIAQLLLPNLVRLKPSVSYGIARSVDELRQQGETLHQSIVAEAGRRMADHVRGCGPEQSPSGRWWSGQLTTGGLAQGLG
ncbi:MAG: 1-acyl-sn-glycerol-3-phosphate acyltransferase, partial [Anaerolineae bacterium]